MSARKSAEASVSGARAPEFLSEIGLPRVAAIGLIVVAALALQSTLLSQITLLGVIPQLVLVVVVTMAFLDGPEVGVTTGFFGGLLQDMIVPHSIAGLTALVYTLVAYGVGTIRQHSSGESVWTPVLTMAVASAVAEFGYALLAIILGQPFVSIAHTAKIAGLVVLYNTLLTPFVYPAVRRIADRVRPEKVHRW